MTELQTTTCRGTRTTFGGPSGEDRRRRRAWTALAVLAWSLAAAPLAAQSIRGRVLDGSNGQPVPMAAVLLVDRDRDRVATAMADSTGHFQISTPGAGEFMLVVERFGYLPVESPLLAVSADGAYGIDFELRPEPLGLSPITVTVRNEELIDWLTLEMGSNPAAAFGFRVLQGSRLQEAKLKGEDNPTETLRWLYIPVWHGGDCVRVNQVPRARTTTSRGVRRSVAPSPGQVPRGTESREARAEEAGTRSCGSIYIDDRRHPNELIEDIDMSRIAVVVTLPGSVRMYSYEFDWTFR
ncbi:MAG: carboxypeptidase-like regulatory domain-containing protein [Longimicrobiales bacterium]|nr:carboxypeptidase-like regulatory domain-containing protein [Longimicrobiales bacterium]